MEKKLEVLRVFETENGDVFFEHNNNYQERTKEEITELINEATAKYKKGEFLKAEKKASESGIVSYYHRDEFLGNAGIHILNEFVPFQNMVYLKRCNTIKKEKEMEETLIKTQNTILKLAKKLAKKKG